MDIKLSVMIPVYNTANYLEKCLKSVVVQSLKEIEIIVVNDGSTDNSLEIIQKFINQDKRIILVNKENGGLTSARNAALKIARGKYCLNIDSDDYIENNYLEEMYNKAEKDKLDMVVSDIIFSYKDNKKNKILKDLDIKEEKIINGREYLKKFYTVNPYGYTWNKLIKTSLYRKNNLKYNEKIFMLEDTELIGRLSFFCERIGKVNKAFYNYRQGENPSNLLSEKNLLDRSICFDSLEKFYLEQANKEILELFKRSKNLKILRSILKKEYELSENTKQIKKDFFNNLEKEKSILKFYRNDFKNKNYILIIIFNILKFSQVLKNFLNIFNFKVR